MGTVWRVILSMKIYGKISVEIVYDFFEGNMVNQISRQSPY